MAAAGTRAQAGAQQSADAAERAGQGWIRMGDRMIQVGSDVTTAAGSLERAGTRAGQTGQAVSRAADSMGKSIAATAQAANDLGKSADQAKEGAGKVEREADQAAQGVGTAATQAKNEVQAANEAGAAVRQTLAEVKAELDAIRIDAERPIQLSYTVDLSGFVAAKAELNAMIALVDRLDTKLVALHQKTAITEGQTS